MLQPSRLTNRFYETDLLTSSRHVSNNFHDTKKYSNIFRIHYYTIHNNHTISYQHLVESWYLLWFRKFPTNPSTCPRPAPGPKSKAKGPKQVAVVGRAANKENPGNPNFTEKKGESLLIYLKNISLVDYAMYILGWTIFSRGYEPSKVFRFRDKTRWSTCDWKTGNENWEHM